MRTYEITVKTPPVWAREGAGARHVYKVDARQRSVAVRRAVTLFAKEVDTPADLVGRTLFLTVIRVA